jgi:hypothetical protein
MKHQERMLKKIERFLLKQVPNNLKTLSMKKNIFLIMLLISTSFTGCNNHPNISKIDSWNNMVVQKIMKFTNINKLQEVTDRLNVIIEMSVNERNLRALKARGIYPRSILKDLITADVPLNKLLEITSLEFVKSIRILDKRHELINFPDTINTSLFIGIIDVGFGFNPDFFGNRVFSFWDQTNSSGYTGTNIEGLKYGVEYGNNDINRLFYERGDRRMELHGSFCSLLAAGNNLWFFNKIKDSEFGEVSSPLIIVNTTKDEGDIIDAISYIRDKSRQYKSKCVINLSYSNHNGAHDGSSYLAKAIDNIVSDSCLIVVSSGNDGESLIHNNQMLKDSISIDFNISANNTISFKKGIYIHTYYKDSKDVTVYLYSPTEKCIGQTKKGEWNNWLVKDLGNFTCTNGLSNNTNHLKDILLVFEPGKGLSNDLLSGNWKMILVSKDTTISEVNSWIISHDGFDVQFNSKENCKITSSDICGASQIISVGGFSIRNDSLVLTSPTGKSYSTNNSVSPNIIAPFTINFKNNNKSADGTSFSAPLVVRTIAKIWEKYPNVKGGNIREYLKNNILIFNDSDYTRNRNINYNPINWNEIDNHFKTLK